MVMLVWLVECNCNIAIKMEVGGGGGDMCTKLAVIMLHNGIDAYARSAVRGCRGAQVHLNTSQTQLSQSRTCPMKSEVLLTGLRAQKRDNSAL